MDKKEKIDYWLEISKYDLDTAKAMLDTGRYLYLGFMCHQAIEKIIKGYYYSANNENPPFIHKLAFLADKCSLYKKLSDEQKEFINLLEPLNVESRYPVDKERIRTGFNYEKSEEIYKKTLELYQWIKDLLLAS